MFWVVLLIGLVAWMVSIRILRVVRPAWDASGWFFVNPDPKVVPTLGSYVLWYACALFGPVPFVVWAVLAGYAPWLIQPVWWWVLVAVPWFVTLVFTIVSFVVPRLSLIRWVHRLGNWQHLVNTILVVITIVVLWPQAESSSTNKVGSDAWCADEVHAVEQELTSPPKGVNPEDREIKVHRANILANCHLEDIGFRPEANPIGDGRKQELKVSNFSDGFGHTDAKWYRVVWETNDCDEWSNVRVTGKLVTKDEEQALIAKHTYHCDTSFAPVAKVYDFLDRYESKKTSTLKLRG